LLVCSELLGDRPRPLPIIQEFRDAIDITERNGDPSWDFDVSGVVYLYVFLIFPDVLKRLLQFCSLHLFIVYLCFSIFSSSQKSLKLYLTFF